ncbi:kinase-like domain-containing protein [Immersiella caudata]|uniref:non-specific serine/threonine protein kinase n=1 Tax=Immersiella caudata TaxID=314043 RepID=A0AA39WRG6_9PEZI|nr:kinase-like domain-containing protein [Immersiella caudata]
MDSKPAPLERSPSPPREAPTEWPEFSPEGDLLEEKAFSWYRKTPENWLTVQIGQVFQSRYQVLLKLGFGSVSTAWLCRDLQRHKYVTLKVYETGHRQALNENKVLQHLHQVASTSKHQGRNLVRSALDIFELPGPAGPHLAGGKMPEFLLKPLLTPILLALDYLHFVAQVVHTDMQEGNIMLSVPDQSILDQVVAEEWASLSPRKITDGRVIHTSTSLELPDDPGPPIVTDFGDARIGAGPFIGEVLPDLYRAPEMILAIPWDEKIDIWALGLMIWDMFEEKHLFNKRLPSREASAGAHLARIISLLGPPPKDLLEKENVTSEFYNDDGTFKLQHQVTETSLEAEEDNLEGEEQAEFLAFLRKMLRWRPADSLSAKELLNDPWLQRQVEAEEVED